MQPRVGVPADGVPGPATLGALVKEVAVGSLGNVVEAAQTLLNGNGAQLAVDSNFGAGTKAATVAYQASKGLVADGIVGRNTWTALFGGSTGGTPPPTDPPPTDPPPTDPEPTDPEPNDPEEPTDPEPTDPEPTEPEPTDPEPIDPTPTDPTPPPYSSDRDPVEPIYLPPINMTIAEMRDWQQYAYFSK